MPIATIQNWGLGLNSDAMPSELPHGFCTSASNVRFRNGYAERMGGFSTSFGGAGNASVAPYFLGLYASSLSTKGNFHIYAGLAKVYARDFAAGDVEITRYTTGAEIASITFVGTTATVTTAAAHGRTTADVVTVYAAFPLDYNVTGAITVTSPTTFTYTMAGTPASNATTLGAYSYNVTSNFTGAIDDRWSGFAQNGIFYLNHPIDGLYYWTGDVTTRLRKVPLSSVANIARPYKNYVIQLEDNAVRWSSAAEPGAIPSAFNADDDNDAGEYPLVETQGKLVDCLPLGGANIIYAGDARYIERWIGGQFVMSHDKLPGNDGLMAPNCVVDTPKGHVFLTQSFDVKIHSGGECVSLAEGRVRTLLNTVNPAHRKRSFLCVNPRFNEVWVCFATGVSASALTALVWNWKDDTWGHKSLTSVTCAVSGLLRNDITEQYMLVGQVAPANRIGAADYAGASDDFGDLYTSEIERTGLTLGNELSIKNLDKSYPVIGGASGGAAIYHGSSMFPNTAPTYATSFSYTIGTSTWANAQATGGRYLAWKMIWASPVQRLKTVLLNFTESGTV